MSATVIRPCQVVGNPALQRVRYFPGQLVTADDLRQDQDYLRERLRRQNLQLHGWGLVCGLVVEAEAGLLRIKPGYAISPLGDDIFVDQVVELRMVDLDLPSSGYVAIRYTECATKPVRMMPDTCACDETACEYSRIQDGFQIDFLAKLPDTHKPEIAPSGSARAKCLSMRRSLNCLPQPNCNQLPNNPWVVLAKVEVNDSKNGTEFTVSDFWRQSP